MSVRVRYEILEITAARPLQVALASASSFAVGAAVPLLEMLATTPKHRMVLTVGLRPWCARRVRRPRGRLPALGLASDCSPPPRLGAAQTGVWQTRPPNPAREAVWRDQAQPVRGVPRAFLGTNVHANVAGCVRY
jgi:hypothetical protein